MTRPKTPFAAALALGFAVLGCGGGPSEEEFAERGNAVCERANKASPALDGSSEKALLQTVDRLTAASRRQAREMRELEAPDDDEDKVEALVTTFEQRTELLERVRTATRSGGTDGFNAALRENAGEGRTTNQEGDRLARELGLDRCVNAARGD